MFFVNVGRKENMYVVSAKDKEYRYGDHGPKYLMKGPRSNFGLCRLRAGEVYKPHVHRVMEENFYVLKGQLKVEIDGVVTLVQEGEMFHVEPGEFHTVSNPTDDYNEYVITCAPYVESDKYYEK